MTGGDNNDTDDSHEPDIRDTIRWLFGLAVVAEWMYVSQLSVREGFTLDPYVIGGMLLFSIVLLFGAKSATNFVDALRGPK